MIRRKWLSVCIALVLCLLLLPAAALAADETVYGTIEVGGKELTNTQDTPVVYATTDAATGVVTIEGATAENYNVRWDGSTLTLRDATVAATRTEGTTTYQYEAAINYHSQSNDIAIELIGENNLSGQEHVINDFAAGILLTSESSLTIDGSGTLNITFPENTEGNGTSTCGISVSSGDVTINGGTVNVTGGTASGSSGHYSHGIYAPAGTVSISGGAVTATGGSAGESTRCCGIEAGQAVNISGGTVNATGGSGTSCGICVISPYAAASVTISGGTVTATGGEGAYSSYGIRARCNSGGQPSVTISGGAVVTATGRTATAIVGTSCGIFADNNGTVTITDSTVNATGGTATSDNSYGVYVGTNVTVTNSTVNATGGTATSGTSCGIFADNNGTVTITDSTVNATGGTADSGNSYGVYAETEVTITNSTVKADSERENGGAIADSSESPEYKDSVVFDKGKGTVYGDATLPGDLTIEKDETLIIPEGSSLTVPEGVTLTNEGSNNVTNKGTIDNYGTVTGIPGVNQKVTGVSLNKTSTTLYVGGSETLTATVTPEGATNKNVTWSTSDASIATVTDGVVTAVSAGTATITVTTVDGGKTDTCTVTVREEAPDRPVNLPDTYDIDLIVGEGGEARLSLTNASEGSTITVTATPDAGYELDYITVDGERIDGTTFTMPDHDVTVRVYFTDGAALPFTDVSAGAWYYDAVGCVYVGGLMDGVSDTLFDPDGTMTRAMVWAILARVDGETVTGEDWIETAREWAVAEGVSDGENATDYVTREQFATMLWRYASGKGYDVSIGEDTNILSYADFADLSEYAIPAMQWACGAGIITGVTDATLVPQGEATRAQVAAMLMRFVEAIG